MDDQRIWAQLDRIEAKLDKYSERLAKAETSILWLRNSGGVVVGLVVAVAAAAIGAYLTS